MHVVWNGMNFFFNSIQSSSQCDIEEYHFCVWWILKEIVISFLFNQTKRHMTNVFSLHDKDHTSNNKRVFPTMTLLSTSFFQHLFIFQQFEPSITFTFDSIIAILKSRQMNRLFLLINYIQSIESLGWRREGEKVSDKMKMNEIAFYQKVKLSM